MKYRVALPPLDLSEVRRYAGLRNSDFSPERLQEAVRSVRLLAEGSGTVRYYPYDSVTHSIVTESGALRLTSSSICHHLKDAREVAVMAVTIGNEVEGAIEDAFKRGEYSRGLLLDAAATTAVEAVADRLNRMIDEDAKRRGFMTAFRYSPGYGDWNITVQSDIVRLAEGDAIGIHTTDASMLIPRKSVTAIVPLCDHCDESRAQRCKICPQKDCLSRKETTS